jgi:hypothetical protein
MVELSSRSRFHLRRQATKTSLFLYTQGNIELSYHCLVALQTWTLPNHRQTTAKPLPNQAGVVLLIRQAEWRNYFSILSPEY